MPPVIPAGHPSFNSPTPIVSFPESGNPFLMLDCHWTNPKCMGKQELSRKLKDFRGSECLPPGIPAGHPSFPRSLSPTPIGKRESTAHPSYPRSLSPTPIGKRESTAHPSFPRKLVPDPDRESGNPYLLDVDCHWTRPKAAIGKQGLSRKTKRSACRPAKQSLPAKLVPDPDRGAGIHRAPVPRLVPDPDRGANPTFLTGLPLEAQSAWENRSCSEN